MVFEVGDAFKDAHGNLIIIDAIDIPFDKIRYFVTYLNPGYRGYSSFTTNDLNECAYLGKLSNLELMLYNIELSK